MTCKAQGALDRLADVKSASRKGGRHRGPIPLAWAVLAPTPEKPWHTHDSWDLVAVYESEAAARAACDVGERVEAVPYFADHSRATVTHA